MFSVKVDTEHLYIGRNSESKSDIIVKVYEWFFAGNKTEDYKKYKTLEQKEQFLRSYGMEIEEHLELLEV